MTRTRRGALVLFPILSILSILATAPAAWAVDVDLPIFDSNKFCPYFTGASGTPIRMTCGVAHHLSDNDKVKIADVYGNTAANGTFYVDVIDATHFDLYTTSGPTGPVASSGTWGFGDGGGPLGGMQFAAKVTPYTLKPHPRVGIDPDGNLIGFAASVGNGLLTSIVVSGSGTLAEATYTRAHGLVVGSRVCVYSASDTDLNCSSSSDFDTVTAVPSATTIRWVPSMVSDGTYNNSDLTVSAWARGGNQYWARVMTFRSAVLTPTSTSLPLSNPTMDRALILGIICHINRADTAACAAAKIHVLRPEVMGGQFGCQTSLGLCGDGTADYIGGYMQHYARLYDLMEWSLTGPEKDTIAEKLFNDREDGCTPNASFNMTGTMKAPYWGGNFGEGSSTMTGIGTLFTTELEPGSIIYPTGVTTYIKSDGSLDYVQVVSVTDDLHATVTGHCVSAWAAGCGAPASLSKKSYRPWTAGKCGAVWFTKHHGGTPLAQPLYYPYDGGHAHKDGVNTLNNMVVNRTSGILSIALALADVSPKARREFTNYGMIWANMSWPSIQGWWGGLTTMGSSYSYTRGYQESINITSLFKWGFVSGPDQSQEPMFDDFISTFRYFESPNYTAVDPDDGIGKTGAQAAWGWGEGGRFFLWAFEQFPYSWAGNIALNPASTDAAKQKWWIDNKATSVPIALSAMMFYRYDPTVVAIDYRTGPTQRLFAYPNRTACLTNGYYSCGPVGNTGIGMAISRKSWTTTTDATVGMESGTFFSDHAIQRPGYYAINRGGTMVITPYDSFHGAGSAGVPTPEKGNTMVPAGLVQNQGEYIWDHGIQNLQAHHVNFIRWRGGMGAREGNSDNKLAYWRVDMKGAWNSGVTTMTRDMAHLKAPGKQEYVIVWDHAITSSARRIDGYHHWRKNGGLITCPAGDTGCTSLDTNRQIDSNSSGSTFPLSTKIIAPTGSNIFLSVGATFPTGYTGGNGYTARLDICAGTGSCSTAGTTLEYALVYKFGTGVAVTESNPTNFLGLELTDWTVVKARGTSTYNAIPSVTTSATTNYYGIGLDPGTYEVRLGGVAVSGCTGIPVIAGDNTILCENVGAGAITAVQTGAPPAPIDITTTTLPAGTQGVAYSTTLAITGGVSPYNCTIVSGALPAPLGISVATISGTPSGSGTSSFTVSCTDSLGATPDTAALSILVNPSTAINIVTTSVPDGVQGVPYSTTLNITGGTPPYNCSIISGGLPPSIGISVATISGTATGNGLYSFTVSCTDSVAGTPDTQALSIQMDPAPAPGAGGKQNRGKLVQGGKVF